MIGVFIEFKTNSDSLKQLHGERGDVTSNIKYSDSTPTTHNNIQTWARSALNMILGSDVTNLLNEVLAAEGVAKFKRARFRTESLLDDALCCTALLCRKIRCDRVPH